MKGIQIPVKQAQLSYGSLDQAKNVGATTPGSETTIIYENQSGTFPTAIREKYSEKNTSGRFRDQELG